VIKVPEVALAARMVTLELPISVRGKIRLASVGTIAVRVRAMGTFSSRTGNYYLGNIC